MFGLELKDLKAVHWSECLAGGEEKVEAIRAVLKGNFVNVLITDSHTAENACCEGDEKLRFSDHITADLVELQVEAGNRKEAGRAGGSLPPAKEFCEPHNTKAKVRSVEMYGR